MVYRVVLTMTGRSQKRKSDHSLRTKWDEHVKIERAHRLKSADRNKCTIIVKFTKYKDREAILRRANVIFNPETPFSVQADYTQRVKKHRRELGKQMIAARQAGQDAKIKYDKLVIGNKIYRYDDERETSVLVRDNSTLTRARGSLFRRSADYRRIPGHETISTNREASGSVNGVDERENDSARSQNEDMGGAEGGNNGDTERVY